MSGPPAEVRTWRAAWTDALYGPAGFSVRGGRGPRHDFSTSATRGPALARALALVVERLAPPGEYDVVDVGAGDGRLLTDLHAALPPSLASRGRFAAVELTPRPAGLPSAIGWLREPPMQVRGLLIAHELLDTVPCEIVERDLAGAARVVLADETLGEPVGPVDAAWLERWWPLTRVGQRAEVGRPRDAVWHDLTSRVTEGLAIAVDYGHVSASRPPGSTLAGWSRGRAVAAAADGQRDLTAHVAMDALRQPGDLLMSQREALTALPLGGHPASSARERLAALAETSRRRALLDPEGLGSYFWLVHGENAAAVFRRENVL